MNINRSPMLALIVATCYFPTAFAGESVVVATAETEVGVEPRAADRRLIDLPALDFGLNAAIKCAGKAESLTLSIADTFTSLGEDAIADQRAAEVALTVPARQLTLPASAKFCLEDDFTNPDELLVPGLATVHASLRCRNKDGVSMHFASASLQVRLRCNRPSTEVGVQDSSPDR